jgi:4'-phosphopantetheinyl transferase
LQVEPDSIEAFDDTWQPAPAQVDMRPQQLHLWQLDLDSLQSLDGENPTPLSQDELARTARFHFERDRKRFANARVGLRNILSRYVHISPGEIKFIYSRTGKPEILESQNFAGVRFNLSHSGSLAMVGVVLGQRIGVDVEEYRTLEFMEIAHRYFSEREYRDLCALAADERARGFFSCWTRKEALLKALGEGIGVLLARISVTVTDDEPPRLVEFQDDSRAPQQWSLLDVNIHPGYAAAAAFEGEVAGVRHWIYQETARRGTARRG